MSRPVFRRRAGLSQAASAEAGSSQAGSSQAGSAQAVPDWLAGWSLSGTLFDGLTSQPYAATLRLEGGALLIDSQDGRTWRVPLRAVIINPPLGSAARLLRFSGKGIQGVGPSAVPLGNGARFESAELEAAAQLERWLGRNRVSRLAARLERQWTSVGLSLVALFGFGYGFVQVGLPLLARQAAYLTPQRVLTSFDQQTVKYLTSSHELEASRLSPKRQQQIRRRFEALVHERGQGYHYRLLFRRGGEMGANAFALPGGTVFITDELVALARQPIDIDAVLAHEISHVTHRDALTQVYQAAGISLLAGAVTGDLVGPSTVLAGVPAALLKSQYSRQMESVADRQAGEYLLAHTGSTLAMRQMLQRLSEQENGDNARGNSTKQPRPASPKQGGGAHPPKTQASKTPSSKTQSPKTAPPNSQPPHSQPHSNTTDILERWLGDHPLIPQRIHDLLLQEQRWKKSRGALSSDRP